VSSAMEKKKNGNCSAPEDQRGKRHKGPNLDLRKKGDPPPREKKKTLTSPRFNSPRQTGKKGKVPWEKGGKRRL